MSVTDRFPNFLSGFLAETAANTFTTTVETLPIVRPTAGRGRSTIMEWLWIDIDYTPVDFAADGDGMDCGFTTGAAPTGVVRLDSGNLIAYHRFELQGAGTPLISFPIRIDLQDMNGFGQLVATDRVNVFIKGTGMAAAAGLRYRIYYRYVTVGAEEYIGIVQSQMGTG